ncbi:hypothetical protein ACFSKI_14540 [Pseudogracilibacillus auburnensis]|uniref:Uncharacterized protein n=1 Tax=Pseudogracilibacillus auburnensis TaxID=1494959 RepID=A0A2V3VRT9_9BACI|nr:hypothetical protein [Pseudogracilibacillus auburnensis]PXW83854.1 hypothetical protein DFR56_114139 [Pseudogracilibacillus auburnensis]
MVKILFRCIPLFLIIILLSSCTNQQREGVYFLSLMGESENWNVTGYEILITPDEFKAGHGILKMKSKQEYITNFFHFETHVVINNEDLVIHSGSTSGLDIDIAEEFIGTIEGGAYFNDNGKPISPNDISEIYMIVEWWDSSNHVDVKERIDLYSSPEDDETFLKR